MSTANPTPSQLYWARATNKKASTPSSGGGFLVFTAGPSNSVWSGLSGQATHSSIAVVALWHALANLPAGSLRLGTCQ